MLSQQSINTKLKNMNTITNSCEKQDLFALNLMPHEYGTFLDVACWHPITGNNCFLLEKELKWDGISIDLDPIEDRYGWSKIRKSKFFQLDATSESLTKCLNENLKNKNVDYLSLDVDGKINMSHLVLPRILNAGVSFKCATIEHESFRYGNQHRDYMRDELHKNGYIMLFEGVKFPDGREWEDWWIDPKFFNDKVLSTKASGLTYHEAVERVTLLNRDTLK
jgi:hypothetical protein